MLWTPRGLASYGWSFSSTGTTRIAAAWGTSVTPGNNTKGAYAQVLTGANVSKDVFGLLVNINSNAVSTAARDAIVDIGVDPAGGSAYNVLIPDLLGSCAAPAIGAFGSGITYFFPIWIKAGSSVAARASVNNATVGTLRVRCRVLGAPKDKRSILVGTKCLAYGITAASSAGTAITPGTTSEGAWTSVGTVAAGDEPWFWQWGLGINNATITAVGYTADLGIGDGTNKVIVGEERVYQGTTGEAWYDNGVSEGRFASQAGDGVYMRVQCSGTSAAGISAAAYGVV